MNIDSQKKISEEFKGGLEFNPIKGSVGAVASYTSSQNTTMSVNNVKDSQAVIEMARITFNR